MIKKPLLAGTVELDKITFPKLASPKLDGIRCLIVDGKAISRSFKPIANIYTRAKLEEQFKGFKGVLDGELIIEGKEFNEISSQIMSFEGEPQFTYVIFDYISDLSVPFYERVKELSSLNLPSPMFKIISNSLINSISDLVEYEASSLEQGYEGVMLRSLEGKYKQGRSTPKEQSLLKVKRFTDSEAVILGIEEQFENTNTAELNEVGALKRSSNKSGLIGKSTMGSLLVRDVKSEVVFNVSSGFTDRLRKDIWDNKGQYVGTLIKYKYQEHGTVNKPRIPIFIGFRHSDDLDS